MSLHSTLQRGKHAPPSQSRSVQRAACIPELYSALQKRCLLRRIRIQRPISVLRATVVSKMQCLILLQDLVSLLIFHRKVSVVKRRPEEYPGRYQHAVTSAHGLAYTVASPVAIYRLTWYEWVKFTQRNSASAKAALIASSLSVWRGVVKAFHCTDATKIIPRQADAASRCVLQSLAGLRQIGKQKITHVKKYQESWQCDQYRYVLHASWIIHGSATSP